MDYFRRRLGARLGLSFALAIALALGLAALAAWRMAQLGSELVQITGPDTDKANLAAQWYTLAAVNQARALDLAKAGNEAGLAAYLQHEMPRTSEVIVATRKRLYDQSQDPEERALFDKVQAMADGYLAVRKEAMEQLAGPDPEQARRFVDERLLPVAASYLQALAGVKTYMDERVARRSAASIAAAKAALWTVGLGAVLTLAAGAALAWSATRAVTRPLRQAVTVAEAIAAGDLARELPVTREDELGQLQRSLATMRTALVHIVTDIRHGSDAIDLASADVASGNQDMSARTEATAASLEETAASMEQLTATVHQNAETAREAARLAGEARAVAGRGGEAVGEVVATMDEITVASRRIADIIGTIDGIAFQTNILALNAAVEAARAGEQGRGFAVVAGEVRNLAQRSAEAAREIKSLIGASVDKVESGAALVHRAGATMGEIVSQVQRVSDLIGDISAASQEQSGGIAQIGEAVHQLDQATQQNAALVEQSAAAAESLKDQARRLAQVVAVFNVGVSPQLAAR